MEEIKEELQISFLGFSGSGKTTQALKLESYLGLPRLSTGDLLRSEVSSGSSLGKSIEKLMNSGQLLGGHTVINLIRTTLNQPKYFNGFLLDNFPLTLSEALKLDELLSSQNKQLDLVVEFQVDETEVKKRLESRWIHIPSGRIYHERSSPPKVPFKDDVTGEPLVRRGDDNLKTIESRLRVFKEMTSPVLEYYKTKGILLTLDASQSVDTLHSNIMQIIQRIKTKSES